MLFPMWVSALQYSWGLLHLRLFVPYSHIWMTPWNERVSHSMDCSPLGSSGHGILQARILEQVAIPFSRGSSQPRDWTQVSNPGLLHHRQILYCLSQEASPECTLAEYKLQFLNSFPWICWKSYSIVLLASVLLKHLMLIFHTVNF